MSTARARDARAGGSRIARSRAKSTHRPPSESALFRARRGSRARYTELSEAAVRAMATWCHRPGVARQYGRAQAGRDARRATTAAIRARAWSDRFPRLARCAERSPAALRCRALRRSGGDGGGSPSSDRVPGGTAGGTCRGLCPVGAGGCGRRALGPDARGDREAAGTTGSRPTLRGEDGEQQRGDTCLHGRERQGRARRPGAEFPLRQGASSYRSTARGERTGSGPQMASARRQTRQDGRVPDCPPFPGTIRATVTQRRVESRCPRPP